MDKELLEAIREELSPMKQKINRLEILLEHDIPDQIRLLAEGHNMILDRLPEADEIDTLRSRVRTLETVVTKHSADIAEIKKAQ